MWATPGGKEPNIPPKNTILAGRAGTSTSAALRLRISVDGTQRMEYITHKPTWVPGPAVGLRSYREAVSYSELKISPAALSSSTHSHHQHHHSHSDHRRHGQQTKGGHDWNASGAPAPMYANGVLDHGVVRPRQLSRQSNRVTATRQRPVATMRPFLKRRFSLPDDVLPCLDLVSRGPIGLTHVLGVALHRTLPIFPEQRTGHQGGGCPLPPHRKQRRRAQLPHPHAAPR